MRPDLLLDHAQEVLPVRVRAHRPGNPRDVVGADVPHAVGDLLDAGHHEALPLLDRLHEERRLQQRLVGAGVEPRDAAPEPLDVQRAPLEVVEVDVGDLELAARRRLQARGNLDDVVVVEIQARDGVRRAGLRGLLFQADRAALVVELDDAVPPGVAHEVAEHRGPGRPCGRGPHHLGKPVAVEDVVAEGEGDPIGADEPPAQDERLGEPLGRGLHRVVDREADRTAITQQPAEAVLVVGRRDDQDLPNPCQHERGQGVVDHRLVVDGHQLLADRLGERVEAGAGASSENDAFHVSATPGGVGVAADDVTVEGITVGAVIRHFSITHLVLGLLKFRNTVIS